MSYEDLSGGSPPSASPSPSPPRLPPPPSTSLHTPTFPVREDCWSEAATHTLIEAWGSQYLQLNRGNLRQKHWQEVADAVNAQHGHIKKHRRTDIQCKNRIDTLKKKYKIEKGRVSESKDHYVSSWPFFSSLDSLIGSNYKNPSSAALLPPRRKTPPALPPPPSAVPVAPRSKRAADESLSRRNFLSMPLAAVAPPKADEAEHSDTSRSRSSAAVSKRRDGKVVDGYHQLAEAIGRFGEIYERVETAKRKELRELETQRMQIAKDLEIQRMKLFQVELEKLKRIKRASEAGSKGNEEFGLNNGLSLENLVELKELKLLWLASQVTVFL